MALIGAALIALGILSRLFSLAAYRRISASPTRDATPSILPATPWFHVQSDRRALKVIVVLTYAAVVLGMALVLLDLLL
jgi:hypothetical protein